MSVLSHRSAFGGVPPSAVIKLWVYIADIEGRKLLTVKTDFKACFSDFEPLPYRNYP
jgi:hypothetical protein